MNSTLSVVMANYNHARYIAEALNAIVSQSFKPIEVFVCDDASTDNSVEIIQSFVDKYKFVHLIRNKTNLGPTRSANKLIALISGDYLYAASADDKILPGFFEKSMNLLQKYPQAGLCSSLVNLIDIESNPKDMRVGVAVIIKDSYIDSERAKRGLYKYGSWIGGTATIFKRSALVGVGGFIEELHAYSDGFAEQAIAAKYGACFIPEAMTCWRYLFDGHGVSSRRDFDARMINIMNVANFMNDIFPLAYIKKWKAEELFSCEKDKLLFTRERDLADVNERGFCKFVKLFDRFIINLIFSLRFLCILTYFMVRYWKYFNFITKMYYRYRRDRVV